MVAKVPVRIEYEDGTVLEFESVKACADNFGVTDAAVIKARSRGALHRLGTRWETGPFRDENGKLWPTRKDAAEAKGITPQGASNRAARAKAKGKGG